MQFYMTSVKHGSTSNVTILTIWTINIYKVVMSHGIASLVSINRLWHIKNKSVRQSHASSRNSEAIDVRKVTRHPPSRGVVACDDYSF